MEELLILKKEKKRCTSNVKAFGASVHEREYVLCANDFLYVITFWYKTTTTVLYFNTGSVCFRTFERSIKFVYSNAQIDNINHTLMLNTEI